MDERRRKLLVSSLVGAGGIGLRAMASGLPMWMLANPLRASADPAQPDCTATSAQYMIWISTSSGDPLNANVPGCYIDPKVYHPPMGQGMDPTTFTIGSQQVVAAAPWSTLDPLVSSRISFVHTATYTNNHADLPKVNKLQGAVKRQEMLVSGLCKSLSACLGTVQQEPAVISNNLISFAGAVLPVLSPQALQGVLTSRPGALTTLQAMRDADVNRINAILKRSGTKAQQAALDTYALSQTQVRSLSQQLLSDLAAITAGGTTDRQALNIAAAVLIKMNVSPAVCMSYSWGGDNHGDPGLRSESSETILSAAALGDLAQRLTKYGLWDKTTVIVQNVFGRTLNIASHEGDAEGRNHNGSHQVTLLMGSKIKPSVIGGIEPINNGNEFGSMGFDSVTGLPSDSADIPYTDTLSSVGHTIGTAVGVNEAVLSDLITMGKPIKGALIS